MNHADINTINRYVDKSRVSTVITLRNQDLLDLWCDEFVGQISDGMWENSRRTEWIWKNVWVRLGKETKVEVRSSWGIGSRSFGMSKFLWECIGDRLYGENSPFKTEKEVRAAWREIANAIYNATETEEVKKFIAVLAKEHAQKAANGKEALKQEWAAYGVDTSNCNGCYWYAFHTLATYKVTYPDGEVRTRQEDCCLHVYERSDGSVMTKVEYHDGKFYVKPGCLKAFLDSLKQFAETYVNL